MKASVILATALLAAALSHADGPGRVPVFDVKAYGASGSGTVADTGAINRAINAASQAGGGTVYLPAGTYLSGSIHLKSNIGIYLDHGAVLKASPDPQAYDEAETNQ